MDTQRADGPFAPYEEPPLVVPVSRVKTGLAFAGSVAFVVVGVLLAGAEGPRAVLAGWLAIAVFGFFGVLLLLRLVRGGVALRADARGLDDRASAVGAGRLSWEEVERVETLDFQGQRMVAVFTKDPEAVLRRQRNPLKRRTMRINGNWVGTPVLIPQVGIPMSADELALMLDRRRQAAAAAAAAGEASGAATGPPAASESRTRTPTR